MRKALWSTAALVIFVSSALTWHAHAATSTVTMGSDAEPNAFKFFPGEISVPVGTTVRWENKSSIPHDAVAENGSFKSPRLQKGDSYEFTFNTPGPVPYICTEPGHEGAGMTGVVNVTGGSSTPAPSPTTATTTGTTPTTAAGAGSTTTTTSKAVAGGSTTTTTAGGAGVTSTTQAPSVTPTSAPETAGDTSSTTAPAAGEGAEAAAGDDHASDQHKKEEKNSPLGIAFAAISTVLLIAISGKLLASKS